MTDDSGVNKIKTVSKTLRVNIDNDFIQEIKKRGIYYKIN